MYVYVYSLHANKKECERISEKIFLLTLLTKTLVENTKKKTLIRRTLSVNQ